MTWPPLDTVCEKCGGDGRVRVTDRDGKPHTFRCTDCSDSEFDWSGRGRVLTEFGRAVMELVELHGNYVKHGQTL